MKEKDQLIGTKVTESPCKMTAYPEPLPGGKLGLSRRETLEGGRE
jgi:hypothetical protein